MLQTRCLQIRDFILLVLLFLMPVSVFAADTGYRAPEAVEGARTISAAEAKSYFDEGMVFVDVRNPRLYARRHIPGAVHMDLKTAFNESSLAGVVEKNEPFILYCSGVKCSRSSRASGMAVEWGYTQVLFFRGGIVDWRNAGYPVESSGEPPPAK